MKSLLYILLSIVAAFAIAACSTDECLQNNNALPLAGFYSSAETPQQISIDSLEVYGIGAPGDSILSKGTTAISQLYMPFRLNSDTTRYVFRYLQNAIAAYDITDTIIFIYTREPRFVSSACGVSYVFAMDSIYSSKNLIDSVTCPSGEITNMAIENINIYFQVADE